MGLRIFCMNISILVLVHLGACYPVQSEMHQHHVIRTIRRCHLVKLHRRLLVCKLPNSCCVQGLSTLKVFLFLFIDTYC